jgi:hypothetical protein
MPEFKRDELDTWLEDWLEENRHCEAIADWRPLARFYADDSSYGWNCGQKEDFIAVGIDEIRDLALGQEMDGLPGWTYPYDRIIVDDKIGEIVGFWRQQAGEKPDGTPYEIYGIGGSWLRLDEDMKIAWQRDFMDWGHVETLFVQLYKADQITEHMKQRMRNVGGPDPVPGYYPLHEGPVPFW